MTVAEPRRRCGPASLLSWVSTFLAPGTIAVVVTLSCRTLSKWSE